jgi:hypothetical protein
MVFVFHELLSAGYEIKNKSCSEELLQETNRLFRHRPMRCPGEDFVLVFNLGREDLPYVAIVGSLSSTLGPQVTDGF